MSRGWAAGQAMAGSSHCAACLPAYHEVVQGLLRSQGIEDVVPNLISRRLWSW